MERNKQNLAIMGLALAAVFLFALYSLLAGTALSAGEDISTTPFSYLPVMAKFPTPTATPVPPATPLPNAPNQLPNPSFEDGWYHPNNIPELQVPNQWIFEYDEGDNPFSSDPWNAFVRPESRLLNRDFLPPHEHDLFIWDGDYTVKVFKGYGAISFRLITDVYLRPGRYLFQIHVFPDLVVGYTDSGEKIWAPDPQSGEVRFIIDGPVGGPDGEWILPTFGQKNTLQHQFEVTEAHRVTIGVAFRGRWAIRNNGWFMDDWSLTEME